MFILSFNVVIVNVDLKKLIAIIDFQRIDHKIIIHEQSVEFHYVRFTHFSFLSSFLYLMLYNHAISSMNLNIEE